MKKKLLVLLGAGSSVDQGMPSVACLNDLMKTWSAEWFGCDPGISPNIDNYFMKLWSHEEAYYDNSFISYRLAPDFEKVLGDMIALARWMAPPPMGNPLRRAVSGDRAPDGLDYKFDQQHAPFGANMMINWQFGYLLIRLAEFIRERCRRFDPSVQTFVPYRDLFERFRTEFDVGIYNLNYDNLAITAWPEAFFGFDKNGQFDSRSVHERNEWGFVYHLHGSIHHTLKGISFTPIHWMKHLDAEFKDGEQGQPVIKTTDGKSFPLSTLIAGGFKLDQILIEPFHSFYAALARHAYQADAILIGGYGFGDVHVNRTLRNCLEDWIRRDGERRKPVMVVTKSRDGEWQMDTRQDNWAVNMRQTLLDAHSFQCDMLETSRSDGLIPSRSFEDSAVTKVSIWHGGFCEAADHLDRFIKFLKDT